MKLWQGIVLVKKQAGVKNGPKKTGWACLAKTENGKDQPILGIDEKILQNKLALCGYAAAVYKESPIQADKDGVVSERKIRSSKIPKSRVCIIVLTALRTAEVQSRSAHDARV